MKILGIIPARGGSKGVPRKNIRKLAGQPLIQYAISAAQESRLLTKFVVTTEDKEIAQVAKFAGCEVVDRPIELAQDDTPSLPVIQHAAEYDGTTYDAICLLQPTSPIRTGQDIDKACELLFTSNSDTVLSVCRIPDHYHPHWAFVKSDSGGIQKAVQTKKFATARQQLPPAYFRNGAIYVVRWSTLFASQTLYGQSISHIEMPIYQHINIDTEADWQKAETFLKSHEQR